MEKAIPTVFYADDDHDDLAFFKEAAESLDVEVKGFAQGDDLLKSMKEPPSPALVFIDLNMPVKSGYELIQEIRQSGYTETPIVVFSTASDHRSVTKCRELGANYFITKPTEINKLVNAISHTLSIDWKKFNPTYGEFIHKH
ncbi:MAG TPA: response regulator [Flavobacterium sp.]|jgi:CheY-like chemotaxis protein